MADRHFYSLDSIPTEQWPQLFEESQKDWKEPVLKGSLLLAFLEPSTRTKVSFQKAAHDLGWSVVDFVESASSLQKSESLLDTFKVFDQYHFLGIVLRCEEARFFREVAKEIQTPLMNAGAGVEEHPTQAAGDALALWQEDPSREKRVVFFGDAARSRVFRSSAGLFERLGWKVAYCPMGQERAEFPYEQVSRSELKNFEVVYCLRTQKERGSLQSIAPLSRQDLSSEALLMHAGPVIEGQELEKGLSHGLGSRSLIQKQVKSCYEMRRILLKRWVESNDG